MKTAEILSILKSGTILPSSNTGNEYAARGLQYAAKRIAEYDNINVVEYEDVDFGIIKFLSFSTKETIHNGSRHVPFVGGHIRIQQ